MSTETNGATRPAEIASGEAGIQQPDINLQETASDDQKDCGEASPDQTPVLMSIDGVKEPMGVAINKRGEVVVAEAGQGAQHITIFSPSGERLRSFGKFNSDNDQLLTPTAVAVDHKDHILATDKMDHCIYKFTTFGRCLIKENIDCDKDGFYPRGVAVNTSNGRVYVTSGNEVHILNSDLSPFGRFGEKGSGEGQLDHPNAIACDHSTGNVYVADTDNNRIQVFTAEGKFLRTFAPGDEVLKKFTSTTKEAMEMSGLGGCGCDLGCGQEEEREWSPYGVAIDSTGDRVYVSEGWYQPVLVFTLEGEFVTVLGNRKERCSPTGLAVDSRGVYVCDKANNCIKLLPKAT